MGSWNMEIDEEKQRAYLTLAGDLGPEGHAEAADACERAAERLDEGFDLINDMRTLKPSDEEAMRETERGKRALAKGGMAAAVRVVSESTTGQMRFDRAGEGEESYAVAKAESVEEAEQLLDKRSQEA
ncbi:hypothetical protein [Halorientalis regularis]|jgi:hypothetical protein|uniref:Uncharacterized protein n=1 Tax=Halorientalis regularis TaxID=660518 RepID=A0A1G7L4C4_9EURY|nr:hypothetical protein [Halorientalis regularis]SDF44313.1 hypothetical protein SAMN05216218_106156 [Halorientalis regularis]